MKYKGDYGYIDYELYDETELDTDGEEVVVDSYILLGLVFVSAEFRRRGFGSTLLKGFLDSVAKKQKMDVVLSVDSKDKKNSLSNSILIDFYKTHGFVEEDTAASLIKMRYYYK
jgi:GNAT superfamily N-acetyltransferase